MKNICLTLCLVALASLPPAGDARADTAPDCESLAAQAAVARGVPNGLLPAIARAESGGGPRRSAWPWTLNVQGQGAYFPTREAALTRLREVLASGIRNVDVGCMQINFHWHGDQFASIEAMIDPATNAAYAARFMSELHGRLGDWRAAARHYHSPNPERGAAYLARVERLAQASDLAQGAADAGPLRLASFADAGAEGMAQTTARGDGRFDARAPLVMADADGGGWMESLLGQDDLPAGNRPDSRAIEAHRVGRATLPAAQGDRNTALISRLRGALGRPFDG